MKSVLSLLLLLLSLAKAGAQDYITYHRKVLAAEEEFLHRNNIPAALSQYRKVFTEYQPFAKDAFTALQLAAFTEQKEDLLYFFEKAFQAGLSLEAVHASPGISKALAADAQLSAKINTAYNKYHTEFEKQINEGLRYSVIRMKTLDDSMKMRMQGFPPNDPEAIKRRTEFQSLVAENSKEIVRLVNEYGFLSDRLIGFMDYTLDGGEQQMIDYRYSLRSLIDQLFYHQGCCFLLLEDRMKSALKEGQILPAMYANMYEWAYKDLRQGKNDVRLCTSEGHSQEKFYNICNVIPPWERNTDTAMVNRHRAEIGLGSLQHYERKKAYEKESGLKLLFGMFNLY